MKRGIRLIVGSALFAMPLLGLAHAQPASSARSIEQFTCKDVMREEGTNREVAIAFLHGFLLGKSGANGFDVDTLHRQSRAFVEQCLDNPSARALDVMVRIKS
jgi:hypothetical protein